MENSFENIGKNQVKIKFFITPEQFEEGINNVYKKEKSNINIQGFRKGRAPRKIIELNYGSDFFHLDGINDQLPIAYAKAVEELSLDIVGTDNIDVETISKKEGVTVIATASIRPVLNLTKDDYTGIEYVKPEETIVSEDAINEVITKEQEQNTRLVPITDRGVQLGDIATIDFEGFVDDVAFDGGKAENFELTIGSKSFIDTFEDQLIGTNIGDKLDVNVTFPTEYHADNLAGAKALFKVSINAITAKELPLLDDDFAQDVSSFDTFAEYKKSIEDDLKEKANKKLENDKEVAILNALIEKIQIDDLPKQLVENRINDMVDEFANNLRMQGMQLNQYLQMINFTEEDLRKTYSPNANNQVRSRLILSAVASAEQFTASEEEFDQELASVAKAYDVELETILKTVGEKEKESIKKDIVVKKALDYVKEKAIEM